MMYHGRSVPTVRVSITRGVPANYYWSCRYVPLARVRRWTFLVTNSDESNVVTPSLPPAPSQRLLLITGLRSEIYSNS